MDNINFELVRRITALENKIDRLQAGGETPIWVDWTPTVDQNGAVAATVDSAKYIIIGDICIVEGLLSITGAGTGGNVISIGGQPTVAQSAALAIIGNAQIQDTGTAYYVGALRSVGATDWRVVCHAASDYAGADPSFALANGDKIRFAAAYRRA